MSYRRLGEPFRPLGTMLGKGLGGGGVTLYTISGTVYDADGSTPVSGATVALGALSDTSAGDGTFTIANVPPGASGSMTCTKSGYSWTAISISSMSANLTGQNFINTWYAAGGLLSSVMAVWQPKGAASLDASYNRVYGSSGSADIDPAVVGGSAPSWDNINGWKGGGSAYLKSGVSDFGAGVDSVLIKYSNATQSNTQQIFGTVTAAKYCSLFPYKVTSVQMTVNLGDSTINFGNEGAAAGVVIISAKKIYKDGSLLGSITTNAGTCDDLYFLARESGGSPAAYSDGYIQAVAFISGDVDDEVSMLVAGVNLINP